MSEFERLLWLLAKSALEKDGWMLALVDGDGELKCCNDLFRDYFRAGSCGIGAPACQCSAHGAPRPASESPPDAASMSVEAGVELCWRIAEGPITDWPALLEPWRAHMVRLAPQGSQGKKRPHCTDCNSRVDLQAEFIGLPLPAGDSGRLVFARKPGGPRPLGELLNRALDQSGVAALITDVDARILYINRQFSEITGYTAEQILGRNPRILQSGRTSHKTYREMWSRLRAGSTWEGRVLNRRSNGEHFWSFQTISPLYDQSQQLAGYLSISHDSTALHEDYLSLHQIAYYDSLCGVANRRTLHNHLHTLLHSVDYAAEQRVALLILNLDNFKLINEGYGHEAGDSVLQTVCHRIVASNYLKGFVARLGGDEFALVVQRSMDERGLLYFAGTLLAEVTRPMEVEGCNISISASVGVAIAPEHASQPDLLLKCADVATRAAKEGGRNRSVIFSASMSQNLDARIAERGVLTRALECNELFPVFQPVVSCSVRGLAYYEALVRWQHPEFGLLLPGEFLPAFKQFGLLTRLNTWMLDQACAELSRLGPNACLSLNIAAPDLMLDDYADSVLACLSGHDIAPARVRLEIGEGELIESFAASERAIARLRAAGVRFYIDDFGVGYASLAYLKRLPVDGIKLDRSFLHGFPDDTQAVDIIASVIDLAHRLGLEVTAEGVEHMTQARQLSELGCDYLQGFLFGKPGTIDALRAVVIGAGPPGQSR